MAKGGQVQETPQERAFADVARARVTDWSQRVAPVLRHFGENVLRMGAPDSFARRHAEGMAATDNAAAYGVAKDAALGAEADRGGFGSSRMKLGIGTMGNDQATSVGMGGVAADAATDDAYVSGLNAVSAIGRGEQATADNGMATSAMLSGQQARADAEASLEGQIGGAAVVGKTAGMAAGLAMRPGAANTEDYRGSMLPYDLRGGR